MYIKSVEIINYQSHDKTKVNLEKGINVFVGTSDSGKSAILRALKWNLTNTPAGDEFIKKGEREATVTVNWSDGHSVIRHRSKGGSKNTYELIKDGLSIEEYTGFGSKVPPLILEVTGIDPELKFNFANQLEAPFLLSDTPKVRAETVGNLEELGKIDTSLTEVNSDITYEKREQKEKTLELSGLEKEKNDLLQSLKRDELKKETLELLKDALIKKDKLLSDIEKSRPRLNQIVEEFNSVKEKVNISEAVVNGWDEKLPDQVEHVTRLNQLALRIKEIREDVNAVSFVNDSKISELSDLTDVVVELTDVYSKVSKLGTRLKRIDEDRMSVKGGYSPTVASLVSDELDNEVARFTALFKHKKHLSEVKTDQVDIKGKVITFNENINDLLEQFVTAMKESEVCPTCYQDTENINKEIVESAI